MHPGPGRQTPDFQKISGVPDSRLQISRQKLEYRGPGLQTPDFQKKSGPDSRFPEKSGVRGPRRTPDSRFPEKIWSTRGPGLQTPDFQTKTGVPGPRTPDSRFPEKTWSTPDSRFPEKSRVRGPRRTPDSRFPEKIWSTRGPRLQITDSRIWSPGPWYSRFFLEIWSLESGGTPDFFWKSGVWSLEVLQIFSGDLESGVRGSGTPDIFWKSGVWSPPPPKTVTALYYITLNPKLSAHILGSCIGRPPGKAPGDPWVPNPRPLG